MASKSTRTEEFASAQAWWDWLAKHHAECPDGLWLKLAKPPTLSYAEALDVALCFGWIDGQKNSLDERYWLQRFTPRRKTSQWSKVNRDKVEALIEAGRMQPAGLREIEAAQADGRWERAYAGSRTAEVAADLAAALDASPRARAFFDQLDRANRYAIIYRVEQAKKPETRARRIAQYVEMCEKGETFHPKRASK